MIMAWTRVFHAYYHQTIGEKYFYKEKDGRFYKKIDSDKKAWELKTCISNKSNLDKSVKANLEFFIKLRNKIEHRHIDKDEIGIMIFGECQALLNNFENFVIENFGEEYALNESLAFALQFSRLRTNSQQKASKKLLSKEVIELKEFIEKFRGGIDEATFNAQEFSIKLISIPKVTNTGRNDLAVEFVNWKELSEEEKENYEKLIAIVKDKTLFKEGINPGKLKPGDVLLKLKEVSGKDLNHFDHRCLYTIFSIRPTGTEKDIDAFNTDTGFCHYDEPHQDYVYQDTWVDFVSDILTFNILNKSQWTKAFKDGEKLDIKEYQKKIDVAKGPI